MRLQQTAVLLMFLGAGLSAQEIDPAADAVTVKSWVGEAVTLLPNGPTRSTDKALGDYCYRMASDPKIPVPASYAGRKGKIVAVSPDVEDKLLTIELENGETITGCGEDRLLFEAEWQKAHGRRAARIESETGPRGRARRRPRAGVREDSWRRREAATMKGVYGFLVKMAARTGPGRSAAHGRCEGADQAPPEGSGSARANPDHSCALDRW